MTYQREIEKKYVVNSPLYDVWGVLMNFWPEAEVMTGRSTDTFWTQPGTDFIRLRRNSKELSVKITDKETIEDRIEENVRFDNFDTAMRFSNLVFGPAIGTLEKNYHVLTVEGDRPFIVALYTVTGHKEVYLEVEANSLDTVDYVSDILHEYFEMRQEMRSLFQIIFGE